MKNIPSYRINYESGDEEPSHSGRVGGEERTRCLHGGRVLSKRGGLRKRERPITPRSQPQGPNSSPKRNGQPRRHWTSMGRRKKGEEGGMRIVGGYPEAPVKTTFSSSDELGSYSCVPRQA